MNLDGKVAIVTGSATGVGAATATLLAAKGCNVVVNYSKSQAAAEATAEACIAAGAEAVVVQGDVADDGACRGLAAAAIDKWGRIDGLVNNAGTTVIVDHADLEGLTADDFQRLNAVNVIGAFQMTRAAAPHMKAAGDGAVVNISSMAGVTGIGSSIAYAATKGALNTMTLSLARALAPEIRVNAICPGFITTPWWQSLGTEAYEKLKTSQQSSAPLKRVSSAEDVAEIAVWLIQAGAPITGETLLVDGGAHLGFAPLVAR